MALFWQNVPKYILLDVAKNSEPGSYNFTVKPF